MDTTIDEVVVEINSNADNSAQGLQKLGNSIDSLISKLTKGMEKLKNFNNSIKEISTITDGIKNIDTSNISNISENLQGINSVGKATNLKNMLEQLKQIPEITQQLDTKTIENFSNKINIINKSLEPLSTNIYRIGTAFQTLPSKINTVSSAIDKLHSKNKKINSTTELFNKLVSTFRFGGIVAGISMVGNTIGKFVNKSNDYVENLNLFYVSMGKSAEKAKEFTDNFSEVLGVDPSNVMRYMGMFNTLAEGFGISSDRAYIMSKNLTQLSYDMSSFLNIPIDQAMQKIKSGFSGEIEPMRAVGVALDQATLQETAYALGIKKKVTEMTRAQKTELLYYQMMKRTTTMQGDMGRTLLQPANAIRVMKEQFTLLARAIGNIFIPIIMKVIPYVMVLTKWLTAAAQAIANFFGFKIDTSAWEGLDNISGGLEDVGNNASGAKKEIDKLLQDFDELHVIDFDKNKGSGSGAGASGGSLGIELPQYDALAGALSQNIDAIEQKLKNLMPILVSVLGLLGGLKILQLVNKLSKLGKEIGISAKYLSILDGAASVVKASMLLLIGVIAGFSLGSFITWLTNGDENLRKFLNTLLEVGGVVAGVVGVLTGNLPLAFIGFGTAIGAFIAEIQSSSYEVDIFRGALDSTKETLTPVMDALKENNTILKEMEWSGLAPNEEQLATIKKNFDTVIQQYKDTMLAQYNAQVAAIKSRTDLNEEEKNEQLKALAEYYNQVFDEVKEDEKTVYDIIEGFRKGTLEVTAENLQKINEIQDKYGKQLTDLVSSSSKEAEKIWENYEKSKVDDEKKAVSDILKQSADLRQRTIDDANRIYRESTAAWENMTDEQIDSMKNLSEESKRTLKEARDDAIKKAQEQRDGTIKAAEEQRLEVIKKLKEQNGQMLQDYDLTTGEVKGFWQKVGEGIERAGDDMVTAAMRNNREMESSYEGSFTTVDNYIKHTENVIGDLTGALNKNKSAVGDSAAAFNKFDSNKAVDSLYKITSSLGTTSGKAQTLTDKMKELSKTIKNIPAVQATISGAQLTFKKFATGGFPDEGQMFIARESGPELVGSIGNRTTVANNDQIVSGIKQGVKEALMESGQSQQKPGPTNVYIGNRKVYSGYGSYANSENNMYGTNVIKV